MGHAIFEADWTDVYRDRLRESEAYRKAAATWQWPLVLRILPDPSIGLPNGKAVYLDLYRGECRDARPASAEDLQAAPYVIAADAYSWKQVLEKKLEPIGGLLRGKLKLERGNMLTLAGYVQAAKYLVEAAQQVETIFPEGV